LIKLVESIRYYYISDKPVATIAQLIRKVIAATTGFAEGSVPYIVLAEIKRRENKD